MKETWRWFGPADDIAIAEIAQTGASGIVSALHHVAPGGVWPLSDLLARRSEIEGPAAIEAELVADRAASGAPWAPIGGGAGLTWDVIESLPVSEAIKTQTGPWRQH
ncbi:MAG: mannonate dehydratase, partial [Pseudomonadota bacterium]